MEIETIKSEPFYMVTLSEAELSVLDKFIGNTSTSERMNDYNLTREEDDIVGNIYDMINNALERK